MCLKSNENEQTTYNKNNHKILHHKQPNNTKQNTVQNDEAITVFKLTVYLRRR